MTDSITHYTALNNGVGMPRLGLGVLQIGEDSEVSNAVLQRFDSVTAASILADDRSPFGKRLLRLRRRAQSGRPHVSAVEPGGYKSKIQENRVERLLERAERGEIHLSEERRAELLASLTDGESMTEPYEVAQAVLDIMSSSNPKTRYLVTPNEQQARMTIRGTMKRMLQLNEEHGYSFDRDELVAMLDELLAE